MRRLFAAADVDFDQWKALTTTLLKLDFRQTALGARPMQEGKRSAVLIMQAMFYTLFGVFMFFFVMFGKDLFLAGTVAMTVIMFIVGTAVLLDHNSAIASPEDYGILGFRPISSRTYFAVRLSNILAYTTAITAMASWLPIVALFIRYGFFVGLAGPVAFLACSTCTALALMGAYAWMLRVIGPNVIKQILGYVQLMMGFLVYGGYFMMSQFISTRWVSSVALTKSPWLLLGPPTWFASYLEIANGRTGLTELLPAAASVAVFAWLAAGLSGRLSLDYAARLGAMSTASVSAGPARTRLLDRLFRNGEARAVALLVRSQFRNDQKFRLGVLGILPLTLVYVFLGWNSGGIGDPFVENHNASPVTFAVLMFPTMLKMQLTRSDSFRASWVFFACPSDRMRIVRSSKNVLVAMFLMPYLVFIFALFTYITGQPLHVLVHVALLGVVSHLVLQAAVLVDPELPFSRPVEKGQQSAALFGLMITIVLIGVFLQFFTAWLYATVALTVSVFAIVLLLGLALDRVTRVRVEHQAARLEFAG